MRDMGAKQNEISIPSSPETNTNVTKAQAPDNLSLIKEGHLPVCAPEITQTAEAIKQLLKGSISVEHVDRVVRGLIDMAAADLGVQLSEHDYPNVEIDHENDSTSYFRRGGQGECATIAIHVSSLTDGSAYAEEIAHWLRDLCSKNTEASLDFGEKTSLLRWLLDADYRREQRAMAATKNLGNHILIKGAVEEFFGRVGETYFLNLSKGTPCSVLFENKERTFSQPDEMKQACQALQRAADFAANYGEACRYERAKILKLGGDLISGIERLTRDFESGRLSVAEMAVRISGDWQTFGSRLDEWKVILRANANRGVTRMTVEAIKEWRELYQAAVGVLKASRSGSPEDKKVAEEVLGDALCIVKQLVVVMRQHERLEAKFYNDPNLASFTDALDRIPVFNFKFKVSSAAWHQAGYIAAEKFLEDNTAPLRENLAKLLYQSDKEVFRTVFVNSKFEAFLKEHKCGKWWDDIMSGRGPLRGYSDAEIIAHLHMHHYTDSVRPLRIKRKVIQSGTT
ncbi:MAG: hypothetical protein GX589_02970 [Deltaproteobacteria bacterium]|nr:hypothetical protein [Deltaproteobacteria bacterium]